MGEMISVIMSAFNESEEELSLSIQSILHQTYGDFEFIIVNDNPENTQLEIALEKFAQQDSRIRLLKNEKNIGLAASLNRGIEIAHGEYIARMDADDISLPDRFEKQLAFLKKNGLDLISGFTIIIDENGNEAPKEAQTAIYESLDLSEILKYGDVIRHPTVMGKTSAFRDVGGYRELVPAEDYDIWLRMLSANKRIGCIGKRVLKYRIRTSSISRQNGYRQFVAARYVKNLYKQRLKDGKDNYTKESYKRYLEKYHVENPNMLKKYQAVSLHYTQVLESMRKKDILHCVQSCLLVILGIPCGFEMLWVGFQQKMIHSRWK
ncbi:glycosyltransferase [Gemmiger sp. An50]|uniref:glycosyltransferase n=1 Tax=Gemmiger sp. An50 TaxID=1965639 RepID=UPI000B374341|nr:glycosyltransferase [Gemmiger sp. An50]OUN88058.1 hypothetical protein B5G03_00305 [Gemmiger sp. An50]